MNDPQTDPQYQQGKDYALRRLGSRECSSKDIYQRLVRRGIPKEIATQIVSELVAASYIDDERFTKALIREQDSRAKGPVAIQRKLREKGIQTDLSNIKALLSELTETTELESAKAFVERKYPEAWTDRKTAGRAFQALLRRGFSYQVIQEVLR